MERSVVWVLSIAALVTVLVLLDIGDAGPGHHEEEDLIVPSERLRLSVKLGGGTDEGDPVRDVERERARALAEAKKMRQKALRLAKEDHRTRRTTRDLKAESHTIKSELHRGPAHVSGKAVVSRINVAQEKLSSLRLKLHQMERKQGHDAHQEKRLAT